MIVVLTDGKWLYIGFYGLYLSSRMLNFSKGAI